MIVVCDMLDCKHNENGYCTLKVLEISPNHTKDSDGVDYTEFAECSKYEFL
jgi:hypothetical protein